MVPAIVKAPFDFLFALAVGALAMVLSFKCDPRICGWIVFGVGALIVVSVLAVGLRPVRRD